MSDVNKQLLEALKELVIDMKIAQGNMQAASVHDPKWEGCAEAIQPRVDMAESAIAAAERAQQAVPANPCWSCSLPVAMGQRAAADGNCPHCGAELDLEDWPLAQQQAEPDGLVVALYQARYVLRDYHVKQPDCGFNKLADACRTAADILAAQPPAVAVPDGVSRAIEAVAAAIYFADGSDYLPTLWDTLRFLSPEIAAIAESDTRAAWKRAEQDRTQLAAAQKGGDA